MENTNRHLNEDPAKNKQYDETEQRDSNVKPDSETLHTTDPQEHMEGPVSSLVQKAGDIMENTDDKQAHTLENDLTDEDINEDDEAV